MKTLSSVKLSLRSLLSKIKVDRVTMSIACSVSARTCSLQKLENEPVLPEDLRQNVASLESELVAVVDCIGSLKQS